MMQQSRIVFDLDHTICIPNLEFSDTFRRYTLAQPIKKMITNLQKLHKKGFYIIIYTSRGMLSCKDNVHAAYQKNLSITQTWLQENNVPYNELIFGKPFADYYVDDKSLSFEGVDDLCK